LAFRHIKDLFVKEKSRFAFLLIVPTMIILICIVIYPMIYSLHLCFHSWNLIRPYLGKSFVGLDNFSWVFHKTRFYVSLFNTLSFMSMAVLLQFFLGLGLALLLNRKFKGAGIVRTLFLLPMMMPAVVAGTLWRFMFLRDYGIVNYLLGLIGITGPAWCGSMEKFLHLPVAMYSIIIVDVWQWTPFMMLILLAGLQSLPEEPIEAAKIDGASKGQILSHIILPLLKPAIMVALLIRTMDAFKIFDLVYILTYGGPGWSTEVLSFYAYKVGFSWFLMGKAATLSWIMLLTIVAISLFYRRYIEEI